MHDFQPSFFLYQNKLILQLPFFFFEAFSQFSDLKNQSNYNLSFCWEVNPLSTFWKGCYRIGAIYFLNT